MTARGRADAETDLPTVRTTLRARCGVLLLHCRSCLRSRTADLQALIDDGGDVPLIHLRFRCSYCGHRNIDAGVTPKERVLGPAEGESGAT